MGAGGVVVLVLALCVSLSALPRFSTAHVEGRRNAQIIHDACATAPFADLCVLTLTAAVEVNNTDLAAGAAPATVALTAAAKKAANTSAFISERLDNLADAPIVQQCFSDCSKNYIDAVAQVEDSLAALDWADYVDVKLWVWAAVADTQTCEELCKGLSGEATEELFRRNTEFSSLCGNAIAIVNYVAP